MARGRTPSLRRFLRARSDSSFLCLAAVAELFVQGVREKTTPIIPTDAPDDDGESRESSSESEISTTDNSADED